ncbi:MAG: hypothetical protein IPJ81_07360 [Chitinophagaceae bacterium]|nr:hypothetical protein [Chitinophagaceae bacterium]
MKKIIFFISIIFYYPVTSFSQDIPDPAKFEQKIWQCIKQKDIACFVKNLITKEELNILYKTLPDTSAQKGGKNFSEYVNYFQLQDHKKNFRTLLDELKEIKADLDHVKDLNYSYEIYNNMEKNEYPVTMLKDKINFTAGDHGFEIEFTAINVSGNWRLIYIYGSTTSIFIK